MTRFTSHKFVIVALCFAVNIILTGCSTVQQTSNPTAAPYTYKADLQLTVNGKTFDGLAVTAMQDSVAITVNSPIAADRIQITSCSRNDVYEGQKLPFVYTYAPSPLEAQGLCLLNIQMFSKAALTAWGMVVFKSDENLKAKSYYNAEGYSWSGFSVGQSKAGLEQSLEFPAAVDKYIGEPQCHLTTADKKMFLMRPERGLCRMSFKFKDSYHRSLFVGYDSVLIRQ